MQYRNIALCLSAGLVLLGGCRMAGRGTDQVVTAFYDAQTGTGMVLDPAWFTEERIGIEAARQIGRRDMMYGRCISRDRVSVGRRISFEDGMRRETVTVIHNITCENGRTRETLMVYRSASEDPYLISAYIIEDLPRIDVPELDGTRSA